MTKHITGPAAFGRAVSYLRTRRCMTVAELAFEAGIAQARVEAIEDGVRKPPLKVIEQLAGGLGTTPANMLRIAECLDTGSIVADFARRVCELREARGESQEELARRAALHRTGISKIERGLTDPRLSTIMRLALGLNVPPEMLVGRPLIPEEFAREASTTHGADSRVSVEAGADSLTTTTYETSQAKC